MTRRLLAMFLAAGCGEDGGSGHAQALIVHVRFMAPLDEAPVDRFEVVLARPGGFSDFDPVVTAGEGGDYTLTAEDRTGDGANEAVLTWPDRWAYDGAFDALFEFDAPAAFPVDLSANAVDGDVPFARGDATKDVPAKGTVEVDLYVECQIVDDTDGRCVTPKADGEVCGGPTECQNVCVDGFCCESACDGPCEQCVGGACVADDLAGPVDCNKGDAACAGTCVNRSCTDYPDSTTECGDMSCNVCDGAGLCVNQPSSEDDGCGPCRMCNGNGACDYVTDIDPKNECGGGDPACAGLCNGAGMCHWANVAGSACGAAPMCGPDALESNACDVNGACQPVTTPCAPYTCVGDACLMAPCASTGDCAAAALCDLTAMPDPVCVGAVPVDCVMDPGLLQAAIDACMDPKCYFRISGTCDPITDTDKDVYVDGFGAAVAPAIQGSVGPAVQVSEAAGPETRLILAGLIVSSPAGGVTSTSAFDAAEVQLLAGTVVQGSMSGDAVNVANTTLTIEDSFVSGNNNDGIVAANATAIVRRSTIDDNNGYGIRVTDGTLSIAQSLIALNGAADNRSGVSTVDSSFSIENCFIVANGGVGAGFGLSITTTGGGPYVQTFRYNTVADNAQGGMDCLGADAGSTEIEWGLFYNDPMPERTVGCTAMPVDSDIPGVQDTCMNGTMAPGFAALGDYHLDDMPMSTCIDRIDPCPSEPAEDFDGDSRSGLCSVGADER